MEAATYEECASMMKSSKSTTSQDVKFPNCEILRESQNFVKSSQSQLSSSPDPTPSEPTEILMISQPGSSGSVDQDVVEEDSVFLTPPEHHSYSHLSSSEDQNPNECCAGGLTIPEARDESCKTTNVRASEAGVDDEAEAKRVKVEEFEGETLPLDETEAVEIEGDNGVQDTDAVLNNEDSGGEESATLCSAEGSLDATVEACTIRAVQETVGSMKDGRPNENSDVSGSLESDKVERERYGEMELNTGTGNSEKAVENSKDPKMPEDTHGDGGLRRNDEPDANRVIVVSGEELDGETVPIDETRIKEDEGIQDTDVVSNNKDSAREGRADSILAEGSLDLVGEAGVVEEMGGSMKDSVVKFDAINRHDELRENCDCLEDIRVTRDKKANGNSYSNWSLDIDKIEDKIIRLKHIVVEKCNEVKLGSDASEPEKVDDILKDAEIPKDIQIDEGARRKRIEEIEEIRYTGDDHRKSGIPVDGSGRNCQLPPSLKLKEKEVVDNSKRKNGLLDLLNDLKHVHVLDNTKDECEEVDIMETAKECGWTFPRVRWWPADGENWSDGRSWSDGKNCSDGKNWSDVENWSDSDWSDRENWRSPKKKKEF